MNVANGFTYLPKYLELEGGEVRQRRPNLGREGIVRRSVLVEIPGNLIEVAADLPVFPGQPAHGGKQFVIDGGHGDDGFDGCTTDGLPDKFRLIHAVGGQMIHEVGVFFLGHTGFYDTAAVGGVVVLGHGFNSLHFEMMRGMVTSPLENLVPPQTPFYAVLPR